MPNGLKTLLSALAVLVMLHSGHSQQITWQQVNEPFGDRVNALAISQNGNLFAANHFGIFRSTNNGANWTKTSLKNVWVDALAVSSTGDIFAGTIEGVFRSTNGGESWELLNTGLADTVVNALAIHPSGFVLSGTDGGLFKSTDRGETWMSSGLADLYISSIGINSNGDIFTGGTGGMYRSLDGGLNWQMILSVPGIATLATHGENEVVAGSAVSDFPGNITIFFRSADNGETWRQINHGLYFPWEGVRINALFVTSQGKILAGTFTKGIVSSTDDGQSWNQAGLTNTYDVESFAMDSKGSMFVGTANNIFGSNDNGQSWTRLSIGHSIYNRSLVINSKGDLFAASQNGILYSLDNGNTWSRIVDLNNDGNYLNDKVNALALNKKDELFAGTQDQGILRSFDNGSSWVPTNTGLMDKTVQALVVDLSQQIWAGTSKGIFLSTDNSETWSQTGLTDRSVQSFALNSRGDIFAGTSTGVLVSEDNGVTWTEINNGLTNLNIHALAIDSTGHLLTGTNSDGVFRSVQTVTSVKSRTNKSPGHFALEQNYPNPFNPTTTIRFVIPKATKVTLKIYDILGREIATLVNERLNPGEYEVPWDASGIAGGVYIYQLQADNPSTGSGQVFVETKTLLLLK
ncbi:MAG: YCF48-related protein [bacterium]